MLSYLSISFTDSKLRTVVVTSFLCITRRNNPKKPRNQLRRSLRQKSSCHANCRTWVLLSRTHINKKTGVVTHTRNSCTGETEAGRSPGFLSSQSSGLDELAVSERPCLKNQSDGAEGGHLRLTSGLHLQSTHTRCAHMCIIVCKYMRAHKDKEAFVVNPPHPHHVVPPSQLKQSLVDGQKRLRGSRN